MSGTATTSTNTARTLGHRPLATVRRFLGLHPRVGVCAALSPPGVRDRAVGDHDNPSPGDRLALRRSVTVLSRAVPAIRGRRRWQRACRRRLRPAPRAPGPRCPGTGDRGVGAVGGNGAVRRARREAVRVQRSRHRQPACHGADLRPLLRQLRLAARRRADQQRRRAGRYPRRPGARPPGPQLSRGDRIRTATAWPGAELFVCDRSGHLGSPAKREYIHDAFTRFGH